MGKTDKDRPWGVMMSDMTVNIHREIWHTHYCSTTRSDSIAGWNVTLIRATT